MRPHGQLKLGFFPLPVVEAQRLRDWLTFAERFSALDPCAGDGANKKSSQMKTGSRRYSK